MTETVYVPAGVPGFDGPLLPLLHETIAKAMQVRNTHDANRNANLRFSFFAQSAATMKVRKTVSHKATTGKVGRLLGRAGKISDGAVVVIVRVEVVEPEPGVTLAGEKEHDASDGNPEHARDTAFVNAPNCWPTEIV